MKAVKVEYQVKPEFIEQNKANIQKVMNAMRSKKINNMLYSSYYLGDGKFMHHNITTASDFSELTNVAEFKEFQQALKDSNPIIKPASSDLEVVGLSKDVF
jgi:hypothetical protein